MPGPYSTEENEFRRRVQQRMTERFTENHDKIDQGDESHEKKSGKKSPYSFENILWLFCSVIVFYFSDFTSVILYDGRIKQFWFWLGVVAFVSHVSIASFLVFWLSVWNKVDTNDWETMYPKAVPLATASFVIGFISLSVALWPVWGILAPVILGALFMGVVVLIAMFG